MPPATTELDPIRTAEILYEGARLFSSQSDMMPTVERVIWFLIEEAVHTQQSLKRDYPGAPNKSGLDYYFLPWEIEEVEREWRMEGITYPLPEYMKKGAPTAAALNRYLEVMDWLRLIRARSKKQTRIKMILALAGGMSPAKAVDVFSELGFRTRKDVSAARQRAINNISGEIKKVCKNLALNL